MAWQIKLTPQAEKDLRKIDRQNARRITRFLHDRVIADLRSIGKARRSCVKNPSRSQILCWDQVFNPQNTLYIPPVEHLVPP